MHAEGSGARAPGAAAADRPRRAFVHRHHRHHRLRLAVRLALRRATRRAGRDLLLADRRRRRTPSGARLRRARRHAAARRRHRAHPLFFARLDERLHGRLAVLDRLRGDRAHRGDGGAAVRLQLPAVADDHRRRQPRAHLVRPRRRRGAAARLRPHQPRRRALARARQCRRHVLEARRPAAGGGRSHRLRLRQHAISPTTAASCRKASTACSRPSPAAASSSRCSASAPSSTWRARRATRSAPCQSP